MGFTLCCFAAYLTAITGDGFVLPVANQFSLSVTQKSESLCVVMACVGVITMSSIILYSIPWVFKYAVMSVLVVFSGVLSKSRSVNVGMLLFVVLSDVKSMSKSSGNGNCACAMSVASVAFSGAAMLIFSG